MQWFLNMKTRGKLSLSYGLLSGMLALVIVLASTEINTILKSQQALMTDDYNRSVKMLELNDGIDRVRAIMPMMLMATDQGTMKAKHDQITLIDEEIETLMVENRALLASDSKLSARFSEVAKQYDDFLETKNNGVIPAIYAGDTERAKMLMTGIQSDRYENMHKSLLEMISEEEAHALARVKTSEEQGKRIMIIFGAIGGVAILSAIILVGYLNRIFAKPLQAITETAERIASGDLSMAVDMTGRKDEIGALSSSFETMLSSLKTMNMEIMDGVNVIASASSEIMASTSQVASGAMETASAISETTSSVEEVKQSAQMASEKARMVSEGTRASVQASEKGLKSVEMSVAGMNKIQDQVESIAQSLVRLSEQSQAIGEIIASVNDLAEQSNLLAVNAAIEAAKAGEQGKGFAVVAQEVKVLAEQSKEATSQVRTILNDILKAINSAVMATEQGGKAVEAGVEQTREAGEIIRQMAEGVGNTAQMGMQIAVSSQQQLAGMDQIAMAMESIRQASEQNVSGTKQVEYTVQNLHELGQRLKQTVERYKL